MKHINKLTLSALLGFLIITNSTITFDKENKDKNLKKNSIVSFDLDSVKDINFSPIDFNIVIATTTPSSTLQEEIDDRLEVALTFDDGPCMYTDELLELLKKYDVKVTFFVIKESCEYYPDVLTQIIEDGHEIAIHGATHKNFNKLSLKSVEEEITSTIDFIEDLGITPSEIVRPPYGAINKKVRTNIDYPFINWSIDTRDWESKDKDKIKKVILNNIEEGSIILMHNTKAVYKSTSSALEELLPELIKEYKFVTVSELFIDNDIELEKNKVYYNTKKVIY